MQGATFRIEPGERVLLLGASGAGKSTLLHGLAGVLGGADEGESHGTLLIDGADPVAVRGRAGLVLQDPDSQVILARVGDDVAFGCENLGVPRDEIWRRVREALDATGLDVDLQHPTARLSGGQKQRLALAGVTAMRPGLLLLDEPTANLDPAGVIEVRDAVDRVVARTGATLVVVEHRVDVWLPVVDRVIVLGRDGVVADGPPERVLAASGADLAREGVWIPGHAPRVPQPGGAVPGETLLRATDLAVGRVRGSAVRTGIDLGIPAGVVTAVTGPNGVGKSTLGLTLAGLLPPIRGEVAASGSLAGGAGPAPIRWTSKQLLTRIGTVFQDPEHQLLGKTVREELEIGPRALGLGPGDIADRVDDLLDRLRLRRLEKANPYTLSGGEKRRLTVAAALATRPRVLILDEPTFGQDARTWAELATMLAGLAAAGSAVVAITHDEALIDALGASRIALAGVPA
ncbi:ABC transporter ATP-binding protein [Microbacterium mangrovi]|uniref:ABC transporter ATP-binding protein n=1 Tax=Microbacterium mangrovi TaxID=1348253 RepID=A0A0B2AEE3_9MICO|nr:ABC transporter ATP-binding protein [Microbacterium mangrovi]